MPSARAFVGEGLVTRYVRVVTSEVVFVKGLVEALEGIAVVFAEKGGDLAICAPECRENELDSLVEDICAETGAMRITGADPP